MSEAKPDGRLRLFIIGAGFSVAAGLPLSSELWAEVRRRAALIEGRAEKFFDDLNDYIAFRHDCFGEELTQDTVNFEEFMGYLDLEHFLGLRGKDTWSGEGNEGTVVAKTLIGEILSERQPKQIPDLYLEFAQRLSPLDWVLTFNYDTLLEKALDAVGKPYRLFANRYKSIGRYGAQMGAEDGEVVVLKLHGSIDWFDRASHDQAIAWSKGVGGRSPEHLIFSNSALLDLQPLVDGPRFEDDPLKRVFRAKNVHDVYNLPLLFRATPLMLAPSTSKMLYASRMHEFWEGMGSAGILNTDVSIIGFSLPQQDNYALQILHRVVTGFQRNWWDEPQIGRKRPLTIIDFLPNPQSLRAFKKRYRFVDWKKTRLVTDGFHAGHFDSLFDDHEKMS